MYIYATLSCSVQYRNVRAWLWYAYGLISTNKQCFTKIIGLNGSSLLEGSPFYIMDDAVVLTCP